MTTPDRIDPWPDVPRSKPLEATDAPEPPELVEQAKRMAETAATKANADAAICGRCNKPRGHHDHNYGANVTRARCWFKEETE